MFAGVDPQAPLIVAESVWQYSHHILPGLLAHEGPILTCANWSGTWPGVVGMLNLNGVAHQGRRQLLHALERKLSPMTFSAKASLTGSRPERSSTNHRTSPS